MNEVTINSAKYSKEDKSQIDFSVTCNDKTFDFTFDEKDTAPFTKELLIHKDKWPEINAYVIEPIEQNSNVPIL